MLVSVTRVRLRSIRYLLPFLWNTRRTAREARNTPGNRGVRLRRTPGLNFWTLSGWDSAESMETFRKSSGHAAAMRGLRNWCDEAAFATAKTRGTELPDWAMAEEVLEGLGRLSLADLPSPEEAAASTVPIE